MSHSSRHERKLAKKYDPNSKRLDVNEYNNRHIWEQEENYDKTILHRPYENLINKYDSEYKNGRIQNISSFRDSAYLLSGDLLKQLIDWFNRNGVKEIV